MTIRSMWTFDHIANPTAIAVASVATYAAGNAYNLLTGLPGALILSAGSTSTSIAASNNATVPGYLLISNTTVNGCALVASLADIGILQNGSTQAYLGFRTNSTLVPTPATVSVLGVASSVTGAPTALITETQLARTVNQSNYVEVFLDTGNKVYSVWVDGIPRITNATLPTGWTYLVFGSNAVLTNAGVVGFRDFYFADADATTTARLGPVQSILAALTTATAPNYTSSDSKTPLVDLTTAYSGAPTSTPTITNAATNDALVLQFTSGAAVGVKTLAVQYRLAAQTLFASHWQATVSNGTNTVTPGAYAFGDTTMDYGRDPVGLMTTDPSGNAWTNTAVSAVQLSVTPEV